jgi:AcrR family transcriptional regulator
MPTSVEHRGRERAYHVGNVRTTLLDDARALLRDGGLASLNLRTLSTRSGVALGSVYHHFGSKSDLLAALAAQGFDELTAALKAATALGDPRVVRTWIQAYFAFAWREPELYSLMFDPPVARTHLVKAARDAAFDTIETAIAAAPQAKDRPAETVHSIAVAVWTCTHGAASLAPIQEEGEELSEAMIRGLEDLFRAGREYQGYPNNVQGR